MLRTLPQTRNDQLVYRLAGIAVFTLLTIVCARIRVEIGPVPFTLQTFAVVLAGLVLGARDGALSQLTYITMIAVGLPVDTRGLGAAAFLGPTAGYLYGFVVAAYVSGWLAERGSERLWQRLLAGLVGMAFLFVLGVIFLKINVGLSWEAAVTDGFIKFIPEAIAKTAMAAAVAEGGRTLLLRR